MEIHGENSYGDLFHCDIEITGANGNTAVVRTGWIMKKETDFYRLTTIFVLQEDIMYKIYDKVILKDGRIAIITDFFEDNYSCVFEIQTNDDDDLVLGTIDDIKQIAQPTPSPENGADFFIFFPQLR